MTALNLRCVAAALGFIVALPMATTACRENGSAEDSGLKKACNLYISEHPRTVPGVEGLTIEAAVRAYCNPKPLSHATTVWLEWERDGEWFPVRNAEQKYTEIPEEAKPGESQPGTEFPVVFRGCREYNFRVRAKATGVGPDGIPFEFVVPVAESRAVAIKCS